MHMIDHLMMAYTVEMISIEKVVDSVKRFSTFSSSQELPFDLEDAMIFWINKVQTAAQIPFVGSSTSKRRCRGNWCHDIIWIGVLEHLQVQQLLSILQVNMKMREITEREHKVKHHPLESPSHQKVKLLNGSSY